MKFTFKKDKAETGLAAVGNSHPDTNIKVSGLVVGYIAAPNWRTESNHWKVRLAIAKERTKEDPAPFKWITLKKRFDSEPEAREFIKGGIIKEMLDWCKWELHQFPKNEH